MGEPDKEWFEYLKAIGAYHNYKGYCYCSYCCEVRRGFDGWKAMKLPKPAMTIPQMSPSPFECDGSGIMGEK